MWMQINDSWKQTRWGLAMRYQFSVQHLADKPFKMFTNNSWKKCWCIICYHFLLAFPNWGVWGKLLKVCQHRVDIFVWYTFVRRCSAMIKHCCVTIRSFWVQTLQLAEILCVESVWCLWVLWHKNMYSSGIWWEWLPVCLC